MNKIAALSLLFLSLSLRAEMLWKPESISFELKRTHPILGVGLVLELNRVLASGETGWIKSRIDVPEAWDVATLEMRQGTLYINVGKQMYYINPTNKGDLSFAILDGGKKKDTELQAIWAEYATSSE